MSLLLLVLAAVLFPQAAGSSPIVSQCRKRYSRRSKRVGIVERHYDVSNRRLLSKISFKHGALPCERDKSCECDNKGIRVKGTEYTRLTAYCLITVYGHYESDKQEKKLVPEWAREYMISLGALSQSTFTLDSWAEAGAFLVFLRKQGFLESNEFPESCEKVFPNSLTHRRGVDFELSDLLLLPALWNARGATGEAAKAAYVAGESLTEQSWDQLARTVKNVGSPRTRAALAGIARNARNEIPHTSDIIKFGNRIEKNIPYKSASVDAGKEALKGARKIFKNPSSVGKYGHELVRNIPYKGSAVKKGKQAFKGARELGWEASKELGRFNGNGHLQQAHRCSGTPGE